jgi:hypothetical protein
MSFPSPVSDYQIIRQGFATGVFDVVNREPDSDEDNPIPDGFWQDLGPLFLEDDDFGNHLTLTTFHCHRDEEQVAAGLLPLFPDSPFSLKDMCRFLLFMKCQNSVIGDRLLASWFGMFPVFLPLQHSLLPMLRKEPSMYDLLKLCKNLGDIPQDMRTFLVNMCANGCHPFWKDTAHSNFCSKCGGCRWKSCNIACYDVDHNKVCQHTQTPVRSFYYMPMRDRIEKLLNSDLNNMFLYEKYRYKSNKEGYVEDIYESKTYLKMKGMIPPDSRLIFLQVTIIHYVLLSSE